MGTKDYGAGVSGYRDAEGRSWETTVYQASKPVLDAELNLIQDSEQEAEIRLRRKALPSGWIADDFLGNSDPTIGILSGSSTANELEIPQDRRAHVNGWMIRVGHTNANGAGVNLLDLGASPTGAGAKRTDLVVLEVWRRLLSATPSTVGKSQTALIWWYGNVKIHAADDVGLDFADDIEDALVGAETTKRVQVQYRLRVIQGVDVYANPYGIDDPVVVANSVPAAPASPDGIATAYGYTNQSSAGDPGLWRAGDGNPANTIGSVDGYMYAIPLMAVFRRNDTAFDRITNHNGGVASPGPSDRPDGLFYDIIDQSDVVDLRFGVSPTGWDYREVLEKNFNWLLDNAIRTEITTTLHGGTVNGSTPLYADEIGVSNANGGAPPTTGDTAGAEFVGQFDAARRRFSDRVTHETVWLEIPPPGATWTGTDVVTINPTALPIHPYAAFNWAAYAPAGVRIVDVLDLYWDAGFPYGQLIWDTGSANPEQTLVNISGLGTVPMGSVTLDFSIGAPGVPAPVVGTAASLFVLVEIAYPTGMGLSKTATEVWDGVGGDSFSVNNPAQLPAASPIFYNQDRQTNIFPTWREAEITYETLSHSLSFFAAFPPAPANTIYMPERVLAVSSITVNAAPDPGPWIISSDGYSITGATFGAGAALVVTYTSVRPYPQNDEQITIYYDARAPQPLRDGALPTSVTLIPRHIPSSLWTIISGSGSQDEAFPFPQQYVQQPGVYPSSGGSFSGDHELDGGAEVVLEDWNADVGFIQLPTFIGYVPNPQEAIFNRLGGDVDIEGRSYYKDVPGGAYIPSAFAQNFKSKKRHRTLLPMVVELSADSTIGRKGQLFMAVIGTWHPFSEANNIAFDTTLASNYTSVSLYRIKGNLLNRRSS